MKTFLILLIATAFTISAAPDRNLKLKENELSVLRGFLQSSRDSLQYEIAARWRAKQHYVDQRESDKEEISRLRENLERNHAELSRIKEDGFSKERTLEEAKKTITQKKEEWDLVLSSVEEVYQKDADAILETFPTDVETRRTRLEEIRKDLSNNRDVALSFSDFITYKNSWILHGTKSGLTKEKVLPSTGDPLSMNLARFGNVFAYGITDNSSLYTIRQSGRLGADRYIVEQIGSPDLTNFLQSNFSSWVKNGSVNGPILLDIMQNATSTLLISGKKISIMSQFLDFSRKGGPIVWPLYALVLWAILLTILKLVQFSKKHKSNVTLSKTVLDYLDKNEVQKAFDYAKTHRGVVANVVSTCLEHSKWNRSSAEKAVKEILLEESPQLNSHLNTLAVIAGSAPMLGLLGTVTGMISLFDVITSYGTGDPKMLAGGISEALITTEIGLIVAIPVLLVHNFLRNQTQHIKSEIEKHAIRILNRLWPEV